MVYLSTIMPIMMNEITGASVNKVFQQQQDLLVAVYVNNNERLLRKNLEYWFSSY